MVQQPATPQVPSNVPPSPSTQRRPPVKPPDPPQTAEYGYATMTKTPTRPTPPFGVSNMEQDARNNRNVLPPDQYTPAPANGSAGGRKINENKDQFWPVDSTMYRNTIIHSHPPEKEFSTKQPPDQWPKDNESVLNYTPFKQLRRYVTQPSINGDTIDGTIDPNSGGRNSVTPSEKGFVGASQFMPPNLQQSRQPPQEGSIAMSDSTMPGRAPSRATSIYSVISGYNNSNRRMSESGSMQQPMMFQPIPPVWNSGIMWGGQAYPTDAAGPYAESDQGGVRIPRFHGTSSRSSSAMGFRIDGPGSYVMSTLPRKLPTHQQPMVNFQDRPQRLQPQRLQQHREDSRETPSYNRNDSYANKNEINKLVHQDAKGKNVTLISTDGPYPSQKSFADEASKLPAKQLEANADATKSNDMMEKQDIEVKQYPEKNQNEFLNWTTVLRLAAIQIMMGLVLFGLGLVRLICLSVWGLGVEVVFGVMVVITGILGVIACRKFHYCSLVAHFVMSGLNCCLAILPFIAALMVTVPESFAHIGPEARKFFTNDNGLYGVDILLAVVCLMEVVLASVTAALGCQMAGRFLETRQPGKDRPLDAPPTYAYKQFSTPELPNKN